MNNRDFQVIRDGVATDVKSMDIKVILHCSFIMPPTLKKLEGHIAFGLSVCTYVRASFVTSEWYMLGI